MSLNSSRRAPTTFHHIDAGSNYSRSVLSSPRIFDPPRSPASTAASSWIDDVASRSSSPSPSQWVIPLPPHDATNQPGHLPSANFTSHTIPPSPALPTYPNTSHYLQTQTALPAQYASPPASDRGSVSSRRSASSAHTSSSTRDRAERDRHSLRSRRHLDTVPCQVCLEQVTACHCEGGEEARLRMREAAHEVFNRGQGASDYRPTQRSRSQKPQVALQAGIPGYTQGYGYEAGHGAPTAYAGSPFAMNSEQAIATGGYAGGYYASPVAMSTSQTWVEEQQGSSNWITSTATPMTTLAARAPGVTLDSLRHPRARRGLSTQTSSL